MHENVREPGSGPQHLSKTQKKFLKNNLDRHGHSSYFAYLKSDHWKSLTDRYRASARPEEGYRKDGLLQECYVCRAPNVDLHHKTYARLGNEKLTDLLPLCRRHHEQIHEEGLDLWNGARILRAQDLERRKQLLDERDSHTSKVEKPKLNIRLAGALRRRTA